MFLRDVVFAQLKCKRLLFCQKACFLKLDRLTCFSSSVNPYFKGKVDFIMNERKIMWKSNCMLGIMLFSAISCVCIVQGDSRTFFRPRSAIEDVSLFLGLNNYNLYSKFYAPHESNCEQDNQTVFIAAGAFYQKSTKGEKLARYFLPNNKSCASIKEDGSGDIGSLWFELIAPGKSLYDSTFTLRPERSIVGAYFNYHQFFCCNQRLWLDVKMAAYQAKHKLRPCENVSTGPGIVPGISNALDYLSSDTLCFGKIGNCTSKVTGFDDIEVKLGYEVYTCDRSQISLYASGLIPSANKARPHARHLFEAIVGRGHGGVGGGFNGGINFWDCGDSSLALMADFSYQYLFKRCECRSFDLCANGDWSRYLKVINNNTPPLDDMTIYMDRISPTLNTMTDSRPAINYLTQSTEVTLRSVIDFWTALHYQHCNWNIELGYNLWWRQSEKVCIKRRDGDLGVGIFNLNNTPPAPTYVYSTDIQTPGTASTATISQSRTLNGTGTNNVLTDLAITPASNGIALPTFIQLNTANFNLTSASHPSCLTNKIYGALSYDIRRSCVPFNVGLGGSYEFADRKALSQWGVWGNFQVMF